MSQLNLESSIDTVRCGALPDHLLKQLILENIIYNGCNSKINPSSIDLTVDLRTLVTIPCVFTPSIKKLTIHKSLEDLNAQRVHRTNDGYLLQPHIVYVAEILEEVHTRSELFCRANPKSSTGRSDIHVRLVGDWIAQYDHIPKNWSGKLYVMFTSHSFPILIEEDTVDFNQLRVFRNDLGILKNHELQNLVESDRMIRNDHKKRDLIFANNVHDDRIALSVDLRDWGNDEFLGYIAKRNVKDPLIWKKAANKPEDFFIPIPKIKDHRTYTVEPMDFFILSTRESVRVPREYACDMRAIDESRGESRWHYAGFIDNAWGFDHPRPLTMEMRSYERAMIYHGQPVASILYHKMYDAIEKGYDEISTSNYTTQDRALLGKFFKKD